MSFRQDQRGQDVTEYGLLLGFIFLVSMCIYLSDAWQVGRIWNTANTVISQGSTSASQNSSK
jgi:Flp pilus assembly pilin Flp